MGQVIYPGYFPCNFLPETNIDVAYSNETLSLEAAMFAYWRVRSWKVEIKWSPVYHVDDNYYLGAQEISVFVFSSLAESEEMLVCNPGYVTTLTAWELCDFKFGTSHLGSYRLFGTGSFSRYNEGNGDRYVFGFATYGGNPTGSAAVNFGAGTCTYDLIHKNFNTPLKDVYELYQGIQITPNSYWSYGGIYDPETGAAKT